jgi:hypothetical protein
MILLVLVSATRVLIPWVDYLQLSHPVFHLTTHAGHLPSQHPFLWTEEAIAPFRSTINVPDIVKDIKNHKNQQGSMALSKLRGDASHPAGVHCPSRFVAYTSLASANFGDAAATAVLMSQFKGLRTTNGYKWVRLKNGCPKIQFIAMFQDCRRQREKHKICLPSFSPLQLEDLEAQGKGGKLAWQGAWHENTKGTAQLCSFFVNMGERV